MNITDDMLPDESLVARMESIADALESLTEIARRRKHLPEGVSDLAARAREIARAMDEAAHSDDPVESELYRGRRHSDGFITFSGVWFYPLHPRAEDVRHEDIVQGLLNTCRYNGQLPRHLSVAEHSIKVAAITEHLLTELADAGNLSRDTIPVACLHALLHDAHEALSGLGDVLGTVKGAVLTAFGVPWSRVESEIQEAITTAYDLPPLTEEAYAAIKQADIWMRYCETIVLLPGNDYGFDAPPPDVDAIGRVKKIDQRDLVRSLFDSELRRLTKLVGGTLPESGVRALPAPVTETTQSRSSAAEALAEAIGDVVPGARPNDPPPPEKQEQFMPSFSREGRADDISQGEWASAVRSSEVQVPDKLMQEPEFRDDPNGESGA